MAAVNITDGTNGDDTALVGTNFPDLIRGFGGDDVISAFKGNDTVLGGEGQDSVTGDAGNDLIYGDSSNKPGDLGDGQPGGNNTEDDVLFGGKGNDTIFGEDDDDFIRGNGDNDLLFGGVNDDVVRGDGGSDRAFGDSGADWVRGDDGNDTVAGGTGDDTVNGGDGNDQVFGDDTGFTSGQFGQDDVVNGGLGNDTLRGDSPGGGLIGNIGFDIFEWDQSSVSGTSTASNVEVDTVLDFHALPTVIDGILGIDHIDLSALISIGDWLDDPSRIKLVGANNGDGFLQVLVDTNDDAKGAYDLKINVFTNSDANWNIGSGTANAEIWL